MTLEKGKIRDEQEIFGAEKPQAPSPDRLVQQRVVEGAEGRLDVWLSGQPGMPSRAQIKKLVQAGKVKVNAVVVSKAGTAVAPGDVVAWEVPFSSDEQIDLTPRAMPLHIRYEDDDVLVVYKPCGTVVHPAPGHDWDTLVHGLLFHYPHLPVGDDGSRPGIVHRLDKQTTGLLVVAKTEHARVHLTHQFKQRTVERAYAALVHGQMRDDEGNIQAPIGRHRVHRKKMAVIDGGREAMSLFQVLQRVPGYTFVRVYLVTGRTHQIRVHMAHVGHPIVGDRLYGSRERLYGGEGPAGEPVEAIALHAGKIAFDHPVTGERITVRAPLPPFMHKRLRRVGMTFSGAKDEDARDLW